MKSFNELKKILKTDMSKFPRVKIAILGDVATQFLTTAIKGICGYNGICAEVFEAPFNQVEMQVYNINSELFSFQPQYTIVVQTTHKLNSEYCLLPEEKKSCLADGRIKLVREICKRVKGTIICLNYPEIDDGVYGSYSNKVKNSFLYQTRKLNYELMELSQEISNLYICDVSSIQNKFGRDNIFDASIYVSTEMVFSLSHIPYIASRIVDIILAVRGKIKKCLIIDLDNTIWGGVLGDVGVEGIELGYGLSIGKAFVEFQQWILKLKNRGIIICVCSKNDEDIAKQPFIHHPEMVLRMEDITVFMANWEPKVKNIEKIQNILNIGYDSMVFIDDSPFERESVKDVFPEICIPEMPVDPADYLEYLYSLNLFETVNFTEDDKYKTQQYIEREKRVAFAENFKDEREFLKSLGMKSKVEGFTKYNIPRVAQLSQKTNQFNLRTVRYTESDIFEMAKDSQIVGMVFSLNDKFGENGIVSVVILKKVDEDECFIDSWFMSCRVFNRGLEDFAMNNIVKYARKNNITKILGEYIWTEKNELVSNHYEKMGFKWDFDAKKYILNTKNYEERETFVVEEK